MAKPQKNDCREEYNQGVIDGATKVMDIVEYLAIDKDFIHSDIFDVMHETVYLGEKEFTFDTEFDKEFLDGKLNELINKELSEIEECKN